jgi:hypothetical protein
VDTSGESIASIVGHLLVIVLFINAALRMLPSARPFPWPAVVFVVLIGVPSLLQAWVPQITDALARDPQATLRGQWWRILTALGAQDGGFVAAAFNLVVVAVALTLAGWIWGRWLAIALYLLPSIVVNVLAVFVWHAAGGGSSFANDGLMFSVFALALLVGSRDAAHPSPRSTVVVRIFGGVAVAAAIVLVATDDAHGVAMLLGLLLGVVAWWVFRMRAVGAGRPKQQTTSVRTRSAAGSGRSRPDR